MPIEIAPKNVRRRVKALTDPRPERVSLVNAGANMTPFRVIKAEDAVQPVANTVTGTETVEHGDTTAIKSGQEIVKIVFDIATYADEDAVTKWLTAGNYEDVVVSKTDTGFVVTSKADEGKEPVETRAITMPNGITVHVTKTVPETAAKTEDAAAVVVDTVVLPSLTAKFDTFYASYLGSSTLEEALEMGAMDGIPPGFMEITAAFYGAMRNAFTVGDMEAVKSICGEMGDICAKLGEIFPMPSTDDEASESANKADNRLALIERIAPVDAFKGALESITPAGTIERTIDANAIHAPVPQTQMGTYPAATGDNPASAGDTRSTQGSGGLGTAPNPGAAGQAEVAQAHGTPTGGTLPAGQTDASQSHGTPAGGSLPVGQTDNVQAHGTATGGTLPAGDTRTVQKDEATVDPIKALTDLIAGVATSLKTVTDVLAEHAVKSDALAQRVSEVENGGRQTLKGADVQDVVAASTTIVTPEMEKREKSEQNMRTLTMNGMLGIRRKAT